MQRQNTYLFVMKKLSALLIIIVVFASFQVIASNEEPNKKKETSVQSISIKGRVVDIDTREGLAGAEITVDVPGVKAFTDLEGNFEIAGLTPGQYTLICSMISYHKSLVENIEVKKDADKIEIALEEIR